MRPTVQFSVACVESALPVRAGHSAAPPVGGGGAGLVNVGGAYAWPVAAIPLDLQLRRWRNTRQIWRRADQLRRQLSQPRGSCRTDCTTGNWALAFVPGGTDLLVLDSLDDQLLNVDFSTYAIHARLSLSGPLGLGAAPSALAVSGSGSTIYVALSSDNAIAEVTRSRSGALALAGRIPTAEYPTGVTIMRRIINCWSRRARAFG